MRMRSSYLAALLLLCATRGLAAVCATPRDPADLGIDLSQQAFCDPLVPEQCMLPFCYGGAGEDAASVREGAFGKPSKKLLHHSIYLPVCVASRSEPVAVL